jgi:hypothetical protein
MIREVLHGDCARCCITVAVQLQNINEIVDRRPPQHDRALEDESRSTRAPAIRNGPRPRDTPQIRKNQTGQCADQQTFARTVRTDDDRHACAMRDRKRRTIEQCAAVAAND